MNTMSLTEFRETAVQRFGKSAKNWYFVCPKCKTIQSYNDFKKTGLSDDDIEGYLGFSCIGRFDNSKGCNWTLGGLFQIHTFEVITEDGKHHPRFELADPTNHKNQQNITTTEPSIDVSVNSTDLNTGK